MVSLSLTPKDSVEPFFWILLVAVSIEASIREIFKELYACFDYETLSFYTMCEIGVIDEGSELWDVSAWK